MMQKVVNIRHVDSLTTTTATTNSSKGKKRFKHVEKYNNIFDKYKVNMYKSGRSLQ